ncbi:host specificity protein J [Gilliamella sp. B14384G15]|uniref:TipJ family phage tail tip protein n=1 Tax=unclassified Gilliamella TaxID=2685620 RepID=UPI0018DC72FC|nr:MULTISPECIES: phage tail protein [unclassified Gilliamella]MBI0030608.1 host specificity protein J [Gilliamella sp. B14384G15]MBI0057904.1 host specificity protein J [Gilliamella sp. B14384G12]
MLGEGQIKGPVNGWQGVFLNDTPVQAPDGSFNFKGIYAEWVTGTQTQLPLEGFSYTGNEKPVNLQVKTTTPITRTITDPNVDRVRVTVGVSALKSIDSKGNTNRTDVSMSVQIGRGSAWKTVKNINLIDKKTNSQYLTSVILDELPKTPFNIRVVRNTPDSKSQTLLNDTLWSSYTEIYDTKFSYPNTALIGLKFDSEQFSGVPRRNYLIDGLIIDVPDNYNPETREYSGFWSGNFKQAWTDNPAWILYNLITNERYGLGERLGKFGVDKFMLYTVAQYCDQLVDDGFGGREPRFTCNCNITEQRPAHEVINDLCSVFRGMGIWTGTQYSVVIDRPSDMVAVYSNANVVDGQFAYTSAPRKQRHTAAYVRYIDPNNNWETATEYVADDDLIKRFELNVANIDAFGCTSRGQAHRVGKWLIQTEKLETQTVTFSVGREGIRHLPGDIIGIADNDYTGTTIGGRVISVDGSTITLDRDIEIKNIKNAYLSITDTNSDLRKIQIQAQPKPNQIVLTESVDADEYSVWSLYDNKIKPRLFKALSIAENDEGTYAITALQHNPNKEAIVDQGAKFDADSPTIFNWAIPPVEQLQVEVTPESDVYQARLSWSTPRTIQNLKFEVKIYRDDKLVSREVVGDTEYYISDLQQGKFNAVVRGVGGEDGRLGDETTISFSILPPAKPSGLVITPSAVNISIRPVMTAVSSLGTQFEFYKGATRAEVEAQTNYLGRAMSMVDVDCTPDTEYWYGVNAVNVVGRSEMYIANTRTLIAENGAGSIFRIQTADGKFPDNDTATQLFYRELGFYPARDTILIIYSVGADGKISHSEPKMYNGAQWVEPAMFLDGDLIATGTMRGDRLIAGTEIKAPLITGGQMVAGSLISSGNPPAFELQQDGKLYARRANISGSIYADSGRLNNVIIDKNCHINGTLSAMQIEGDIVKMYPCPKNGSITIHPAPFDREFHIQPITLSAVAFYAMDSSLEIIRWDLGLLEIFIRNEHGNFSRRYTIETSRQNLTVTRSYHGDIPAGERFYISTSTPRNNLTHGIPDFITIMVVKK